MCLFDDHGVDNLKIVSISQWMSNQRTLIVHGAGEMDNEDSYITIVSVPKLGCLDCKKIHEELNTDPFECIYILYANLTYTLYKAQTCTFLYRSSDLFGIVHQV